MTSPAASISAPAPPSIARAALVFLIVGPAVGPLLFGLFLGIVGLWNLGPGSILVGAAYFLWFLPFFYAALALPFLATGIAYAIAARRLARRSLMVALVAGAAAFAVSFAVIYLAAWIAVLAEFAAKGPEDYEALSVSNLGTLAGVMAIGVVPAWWLTRDRRAGLCWI